MFTFANPWLFWFFPALALPWIFRRRQEERIRHINFPLLQFLRESEEKELVNPQLQEFLLLLLRTLLLGLLILALSGPKWISNGAGGKGWLSFLPFNRSFQNHLVVMDSSYSMGYGRGEQSWWREAERTWETIDRELAGFSTRLVRWDRSTVQSNRTNRLSPLSAVERDSLFASKPENEGTSILELFDALRETSEGAENVILLTDGQRFPWRPLLEGSFDKSSIPPIFVATVGDGPVNNVWCEVNTLSSPPWGVAGWETVAGTVKGVLQEPLQDGTVSILRSDNNETLYSRAVDYPESLNAPVEIPFEFTTPFSRLRAAGSESELDIVLRVEPLDLLPLDNEIRLRLPMISAFNVGLVCRSGDSSVVASVLQSAVNPLKGTPESPPVLFERLSPPNMILDDRSDLVVLAGDIVDDWLASAEIPPVMEYVKNGGSLVVFTGGNNSSDGAWLQLLTTVGWKWIDPESTAGRPSAISIGGTGLLVEALGIWDSSMWESWIPNRHGRMEGEGVLPIVTYRIGERTAYLVSQATVGKGRVWIVNASLQPNANALLSPILPALIWETGKEVARNKITGLPVVSRAKAESDLTLLTDEEKQLLNERYGIHFAAPSTFTDEIDAVYGGTDLRIVLLFVCLVLALGESWLSNYLASL